MYAILDGGVFKLTTLTRLQSIHDPMAEGVAVALGQLTTDLKDAVNSLLYDDDYVLREEYAKELLTYVQVCRMRSGW